jgi:hypothetical protein
MQARNILIIPDTGSISRPSMRHFHFVLRAKDEAGCSFLAPVGSTRPNSDRTCLLSTDECPWLTQESIVLFARVRLWSHGDLANGIRRGRYVLHQDMMSEALFERVCACLRRSPLSPGWARKYVNGC